MHAVQDLMRRQFIRIEPDADPRAALELMEMARVRSLPVLARGAPPGWILHRDLAQAALDGSLDQESGIGRWVRPGLPVPVHMPLSDAVEKMLEADAPCLMAADFEADPPHIVGLVTESDLLRAAYLSANA